MARDELSEQQAMTAERLAEIRAQLQRIARAPWSVTPHADAMQVWADDGDRVAVVEGMQATADPACFADERDNARFIAAAPTSIAALLAEVERLRAREAAMLAVVGQVAQPPHGVELVPVYVTPAIYRQARVLLASADSERSGGDGG